MEGGVRGGRERQNGFVTVAIECHRAMVRPTTVHSMYYTYHTVTN